DAHQAGGVAAFAVFQHRVAQRAGGVRALREGLAKAGAEGVLGLDEQAVQGAVVAGRAPARRWARTWLGWRTGIVVPLARGRRRPLFAEISSRAPLATSASSSGARGAAARAGSVSWCRPAAPQQPVSGSSTRSRPGTLASSRRRA